MTACLCKVSEILAEFNEVFSFEKFLIYVSAKDLIETLYMSVVIRIR